MHTTIMQSYIPHIHTRHINYRGEGGGGEGKGGDGGGELDSVARAGGHDARASTFLALDQKRSITPIPANTFRCHLEVT